MADAAQKQFRWKPQGERSAFAYSGRHIIGHVVCRTTDNRWVWSINDVVGSKYQKATRGESATESGAKAALRKSWLNWLGERGLQESLA